MSLPELIPSNLPVYVQNKARTNFSNSVIPSGSVLLFAESDGNGGSNLIAKNPDGTFTEIGGGGGGSMNFYKCSSLNTINSTWTGYKAVLNQQGYYEFETTVTTGLDYTLVTPIVGEVYSADALVKAQLYEGIPVDGLIFYAPLKTASLVAATGQGFTVYGSTPTASTVAGIECLNFTNGFFYSDDLTGFPTENAPFTMSVWMYATAKLATSDSTPILGFGNPGYNDVEIVNNSYNNKLAVAYWKAIQINIPLTDAELVQKWLHLLVKSDGSTVSFYINGTMQDSASAWSLQSGNHLCIGGHLWGNYVYYHTGYCAAARIYNRALTSSEIAALANELTPTNN